MIACRASSLLAATLAMLLAGDAAAQPPGYDAIPARMSQLVDEYQAPGMVTLVCQAGQTVHLGAAGLANVESRVPMKADAIFGVMSMTKPITATALMILVDEGKVGLEDRVDKYIPAFAHAKLKSGEPVTGLTVRSLLTHTSGLTGDQMCVDSLEATAAALAARPFEFQPGTRWEYGPSLNVIGRIIEIASGQGYEAFVSERILKPLKMTDATFHVSAEQRPRLAALYAVDEGARGFKPAARWGDAGEPDCVPNPSGGLFATAADMARFYNMILAGGALDGVRIVSAEAVREMTSVQTGELVTGFTPGNGWGLGWCVVREPQGLTAMLSPGTFGHGGAYGTQGWVDPERRAVFVLMTQRSNFPNSDGSDVRREFQRLAADALDAE